MNNVLNTLKAHRINAVLQARYFAHHPDKYYVVLPVGALELVLDEYWGTYEAKVGEPTPTTKAIAYGTALRTKDGSGSKAKAMRCVDYWQQEVANVDDLIASLDRSDVDSGNDESAFEDYKNID